MLSSGVNTLEKVLHRSGALTTNWNRLDFNQFKVFVNSWRELQCAANQRKESNLNSFERSRDTDSVASSDRSVEMSVVRRRTIGAIEIRRDTTRLQESRENAAIDDSSSGVMGEDIHPDMFSYETLLRTSIPPPKLCNTTAALSPTFGEQLAINGRDSPKMSRASFSQHKYQNTKLSPSHKKSHHAAMTLLEYWQSNTGGPPSVGRTAGGFFGTGGVAAGGQIAQTKGRGVIVYERSLEVGLIVRANPSLGIHEDAWCQYTPPPAGSQPPPGAPADLSTTFAALLVHLLPQTRHLMRLITPVVTAQSPVRQQDVESPYLQIPPGQQSNVRITQRKNSSTAVTGNSLLQFQMMQQQQSAPSPVHAPPVQSGFGGGGFGFGAREQRDPNQPPLITVSYYSHNSNVFAAGTVTSGHGGAFGAPQQQAAAYHGPPAAPNSSGYYRTVGTLDSQFHAITSKFLEDASFHDIILR
eukprot:gene38780-47896_t